MTHIFFKEILLVILFAKNTFLFHTEYIILFLFIDYVFLTSVKCMTATPNNLRITFVLLLVS